MIREAFSCIRADETRRGGFDPIRGQRPQNFFQANNHVLVEGRGAAIFSRSGGLPGAELLLIGCSMLGIGRFKAPLSTSDISIIENSRVV